MQPVPDGFAAAVHVGAGLEQDKSSAFVPKGSHVAQGVVFKRHIERSGEVVNDIETDVVTGIVIIGAHISEAGDEVFHIFVRLVSFGLFAAANKW